MRPHRRHRVLAGDYDEALRIRRQVQLPVYERLGDTREAAVTWGQIADIEFLRGDYDEALRVRREVELPVYERMGDARSVAITWGQIADIEFLRGDYDEALRIRRQVQLPVYERLGDTREVAVTWGKIADVAYLQGDYEEALRVAVRWSFRCMRSGWMRIRGSVISRALPLFDRRCCGTAQRIAARRQRAEGMHGQCSTAGQLQVGARYLARRMAAS